MVLSAALFLFSVWRWRQSVPSPWETVPFSFCSAVLCGSFKKTFLGKGPGPPHDTEGALPMTLYPRYPHASWKGQVSMRLSTQEFRESFGVSIKRQETLRNHNRLRTQEFRRSFREIAFKGKHSKTSRNHSRYSCLGRPQQRDPPGRERDARNLPLQLWRCMGVIRSLTQQPHWPNEASSTQLLCWTRDRGLKDAFKQNKGILREVKSSKAASLHFLLDHKELDIVTSG